MKTWWRRILRNKSALVGSILTLLILFIAVSSPLLAPYSPFAQIRGRELQQPSSLFLLGSDELGRDILSRMLFGLRISLEVGVLAVILGSLVGLALGVVAGWSGGWVSTLILRIADALLAYPPVLVGIGVTAVLGPGPINIAIAASITSVPVFVRVARVGVLEERVKDYVVASIALGATPQRTMLRHVLPNIIGTIFVQVAVTMAFAVNMEAGLSFLGLGAQPPEASLGSMLQVARLYMRQAPWYSLFPGALLALMLVGLNLLAAGLRDLIDPRTRKT